LHDFRFGCATRCGPPYVASIYFLIWLQYIVYDPAFPAFIKFAIVFFGTLSMSWALTVLLRKIPS
jgi:hypothetical protein